MAQLLLTPNIASAIKALNSSCWFNISGPEPTNETQYKERVVFYTDVTGETTTTAPLTWAEVKAKYDELNTAHTNQEYARKRRNSYETVGEQLDTLYHDIDDGKLDKTGAWFTSVKTVKDANPKP